MEVPLDIINELLSEAHSKLSVLPQDDPAAKYFTVAVKRLINELNAQYIYIRYKFTASDEWDYAKFEKSWFDEMGDDDIEEEVTNYPENSWMHDSWRTYSITYEICTRDEYEKIKGF